MSDVFFLDPNHPPFYQLISFTTVGSHTFDLSMVVPPDDGYDIDYLLVTCYGGGEGGARADNGARGGRNGGRVTARMSPQSVGGSQSVVVGAPGVGRSGSNGPGGAGGVSSFGTLVSSVVGSSSIPTIFGDLPSSGCPGDGGSAIVLIRGDTKPVGTIPASNGGSSSGAAGGVGAVPASYWGSSASGPTSGEDGDSRGWYTTGGGGGGGGGLAVQGTSPNYAGGHGGSPGGGGGGAANVGGNGGRGQVDVLAVFKPRDLSGA